MDEESFHVVILKNESGVSRSHAIKLGKITKDDVEKLFDNDENRTIITDNTSTPNKEDTISPYPNDFEGVEKSFSQSMSMYRDSVVATVRLAPVISSIMITQNIEEIAIKRGEKLEELCTDDKEVYSLPIHTAPKIQEYANHANAALDGSEYLPKIATIGLISSYDAIISDLLRVIFQKKPEIIFTSDREIKFSDLNTFETINDVKESIISKEIESVIRQSHHEQFFWMEKKFSIKLRENLSVWPDFIELCERRNLLTHTGGYVSEQYLSNCEKFGKKTQYKLGEKLDVDLDYFRNSINTVSEIGFKLIHTMWRKFAPSDREEADATLNTCGMNLIAKKQYFLAERILDFGVNQKSHHSDLVKRMMIVNLANAIKLGGNLERCKKLLNEHDWSATSYHFQICVAAVKNDLNEVIRLLKLGPDIVEINPTQFRDWPVFTEIIKEKEFINTFEEVFSEPLFRDEIVMQAD